MECYIDTKEKLDGLCRTLMARKVIAVDTEFIREKTYWPQLCLIQVSDGEGDYCIDPLAPGMDLSSFSEVLACPDVLKLFHAARQDIEIFFHINHKIPSPVFDTQVAGMVIGLGDSVSYQSIVNIFLHAQITKEMRFSDWSKRPLSEAQIKYALNDVHYLIPAYEKIRAVLEKKNRASWMKDEMQILLNPETYAPDLMQLWRKIKINTKKPLVLKTLQVLTAWREMDAQRADKPRRSMLKDDTLIELAMARPTSMEALKSLRGMSSGHFPKNARGQEIVDLIKNVSLTPKEEKEFLLLTEQKKKKVCHGCVEALRLLLESVSETEQVAPKIICHAEDLEKIAAEGKNADVPAMKGWRFDIFGRHALELIEGKIGLFFDPVGQKMKITGKS